MKSVSRTKNIFLRDKKAPFIAFILLIEYVCFFPNATRTLQMCDVGMFSPEKKTWQTEVHQWRNINRNKELDEVCFVPLLKAINDKFIKKETIHHGFKATGIHLLNVEKHWRSSATQRYSRSPLRCSRHWRSAVQRYSRSPRLCSSSKGYHSGEPSAN